MKFALEFLGSSLSLPLRSGFNEIIDKSLQIYKKWIGFPDGSEKILVPEIDDEERQYIYQVIIVQLAGIFNRQRKDDKQSQEKLNSFCNKVLSIYNFMANNLGDVLSETTWTIFLRTNIEIAHKYLSVGKNTYPGFEEIRQKLIDGIFEYWLRSGLQDTKLFAYFSSNAITWINRKNVIQSWARFCRGLSRRMLSVIYGIKSNTSGRVEDEKAKDFLENQHEYVRVEIPESNKVWIFNLPNNLLIYFWAEFTFLFEKRIRLNVKDSVLVFDDIGSYKTYINELKNILKEFSTVDVQTNDQLIEFMYLEEEMKKEIKPTIFQITNKEFNIQIKELLESKTLANRANGDIMLKIFGANLLGTVKKHKGSFEYERLFYAEVCSLITSFLGPYSYKALAWLYFTLEDFILKYKGKLQSANELIINSCDLFALNYYGVRLLVPPFVEYINELIKPEAKAEVIQASLKILAQLISSCSNFLVTMELNNKELASILSFYEENKRRISELLNVRFKEGKLVCENTNTLIWIAGLDAVQNKSPKDSLDFICYLINEYISKQFDDCLMNPRRLQILFSSLDVIEMIINNLKSERNVIYQTRSIIILLIGLVDKKLDNITLLKKLHSDSQCDKVFGRIIQTCLVLLNASPLSWDEKIGSILANVLKKCTQGYNDIKQINFFYVAQVANYAFEWLMLNNHKDCISNYSISGDTAFCTKDGKLDLFDPSIKKTHLLLMKEYTMITLYELTFNENKYECLIVIRNDFVRHAFHAELFNDLNEFIAYKKENEETIEVIKSTDTGALITYEKISEIKMTKEELIAEHEAERALEAEIEKEEAAISNSYLPSNSIETEYNDSLINVSHNTLARIFLTQFQMLHSRNISSTYELKESAELLDELQAIDNISCKYLQKIPILYYKSALSKTYEINHEDPYFNEIVGELGISLKPTYQSTGNFNNLSELIKDVEVIYNAELFDEKVFIVPSIRLNDPQAIDNVILSSNVILIWNAQISDPYDFSIPSNALYSNSDILKIGIVITPLKNELFKIGVVKSQNNTIRYTKYY